MTISIVSLLLVLSAIRAGQSSNPDVLRRILNDSYDNQIRPNVTGPAISISVYMLLTSIHSISEISMDYGVTMFLTQEWIDPRLSFNGSDSVDLRSGSELEASLWTPDLYFVNVKKGELHEVTMTNKQIRVYPNGQVIYDIRASLTLICYMYLQRFPMDQQNCGIDLESFGYTTRDVMLQWHPNHSVILPQLVMPGFSLSVPDTSAIIQEYPMGQYSRLHCMFNLERELIFYIMEHYVPSFLLVILSWVSFWLSVDATPARASLGITTVLTLTTLSSGARVELPKVSYTKAIDVWMVVCSFFVFAALLEFAIASYFHKTGERRLVENRIKERLHILQSANISERNRSPSMGRHTMVTEMTNNGIGFYGSNHMAYETRLYMPQTETNVKSSHRKNLMKAAMTIDRLSRVLFPASFALFNIVYWPTYLRGYLHGV